MPSVLASDQKELNQFVQLCSGLTGYDHNELWGTGMAQTYFEQLKSNASRKLVGKLLAYCDDVVQVFSDPDEKLVQHAKALIRLWYLGQWWVATKKAPIPPVVYSLNHNAYIQALAWRAMGGHPQGARQQGYASWSKPPIGAVESES